MLEFGPERGGDDDVGAALLHGCGCRGPFGGSGVGGGVPEGREEIRDVVYGMGGVRVEVAGEGRLGPGVGEQVGWWRWRGWLVFGAGMAGGRWTNRFPIADGGDCLLCLFGALRAGRDCRGGGAFGWVLRVRGSCERGVGFRRGGWRSLLAGFGSRGRG